MRERDENSLKNHKSIAFLRTSKIYLKLSGNPRGSNHILHGGRGGTVSLHPLNQIEI